MPSRESQKWVVRRNGQVDPSLQVLKIQESEGGRLTDYAELIIDPEAAKEVQDFSLKNVQVSEIEVEAVGGGANGVKHWGAIASVHPTLGPSGETIKLVSRLDYFHFGRPLNGVPMYSPAAEKVVEADVDLVFNPEIDGRTAGNRHSSRTAGQGRMPVFLHPESVRTPGGRDLQGGRAVEWTLSRAVYTLCFLLNPAQKYIRNPPLNFLVGQFDDRADLVRGVTVPRGTYLPDALDRLLKPLGYLWRVQKFKGRRILDFYRRGTGGKAVWLKHQRNGETLDTAKTNVQAEGVRFSVSRLANAIRCVGSHRQVEVTTELIRGWPESLDDTSMDELMRSAEGFQRLSNVWRRWVVNEAGDYTGLREDNQAIITRNATLFTLNNLVGGFIPRRRKMLPCLTLDPATQEPIGNVRGVQVEYFLPADDNDEDAGTWLPIEQWGANLLSNEAGVYFGGERVPELLYDLGPFARLRATYTLETDFRVTGFAGRRAESPQREQVEAVIDLADRYHWRTITPVSQFYGSVEASLEADDRIVIQRHAEQLRDAWDLADVAGGVSLEGCDHHEYKVGQRVLGIEGRNIRFNADSGDSRFPQIASITHDVTNQKTLLELTRPREFRA